MNIKDNVFVITGAGNGIGRAIALEILAMGGEVAGCDIKLEDLKQTKSLAGDLGEKMSVFELDITDTQKVADFPSLVIEKHGKVDGLLNVAGIIQPFIKFMDLPIEKINQVMNVNFNGTLHMIRAFLPHLLNNKTKASIVNISSMAGFVPFPRQSIYGASKGALKMLSEGLYAELKDTNVTVSVVSPGGVATDIIINSKLEMKNSDSKKSKSYKLLTPKQAAEIVVDTIVKEKFKVVAGKDAKSMDILYRISPKKAINILIKNMKGMFND
jgi:NADP-dependent 3-hydroxy acid dehydrogenase YdfG